MSAPHLFTLDELDALSRDELDLLVLARGVDVGEGTGVNGNVIVADLVDAILEHQDRTGINPALEAVPVPVFATPKRYRVTAPTAVYDHPPGEEFVAMIPAVEERLHLEAGTLAIVDGQLTEEESTEVPVVAAVPADASPVDPLPASAASDTESKE